ncbi:MAG: hypothetical protein OJF51_005140 [Nitrospira sp.]|nr:MAG: hypothetical protein OJF51_005140 [Nitrospira sp.]
MAELIIIDRLSRSGRWKWLHDIPVSLERGEVCSMGFSRAE